MNEKWLEEIKRNDEMTMLDRYFPGKSCGNAECEKHYIQILQILRALNIDYSKYHAVIGANPANPVGKFCTIKSAK